MKVSRILLLSIKAGSGHIRAAAAVETALRECYPQIMVKNVEALQYTNPTFAKTFTETYNRLATELPSVWGYIYEQMERKPANSRMKQLSARFSRLNAPALSRLVREYDPDVILCTHYFPAEVLAARQRRGKLRARLCLVLTDYDIHSMWIQPGVAHYFVATDEMKYALRMHGVGENEITVTGIPVMPVFARGIPDRVTVRQQLGLRVDSPVILVMAGGFGLAAIDQCVGTLADMVPEAQLLAVAGNNARLHATLIRTAATRHDRIFVFPFVNNMHELMAASDLVVTKSGGLTSSECLALGVPMIIFQPIPGQEERNATYLLENGAALRANSPPHLIFKARLLLNDPGRLKRMSEAAHRIARPRAAYEIAAALAAGASR